MTIDYVVSFSLYPYFVTSASSSYCMNSPTTFLRWLPGKSVISIVLFIEPQKDK